MGRVLRVIVGWVELFMNTNGLYTTQIYMKSL